MENKMIKKFKQFEQAIYSANWKEEFDEEDCPTLELSIGDEFEMIMGTGKHKYIGELDSTKKAFYRGKKDDLRYFSYTLDGSIYKLPISELKERLV